MWGDKKTKVLNLGKKKAFTRFQKVAAKGKDWTGSTLEKRDLHPRPKKKSGSQVQKKGNCLM